jgi:transposase
MTRREAKPASPKRAWGARHVALVATLNAQIRQLGTVMAEHFGRHPDAEIYTSQPGLGVVLAARVLGEFGDDPHRYADAKSRKNYAGTSPITKASGRKKLVLARYARNKRLADALQQWALSSLRGSPGARPTTTSSATATSATTPPCARSPTASSASCTAA